MATIHIKDSIYLCEVPLQSYCYIHTGSEIRFYRDYGDGHDELDFIWKMSDYVIIGSVAEYDLQLDGYIHPHELLYLMGKHNVEFYGCKYIVLFKE